MTLTSPSTLRVILLLNTWKQLDSPTALHLLQLVPVHSSSSHHLLYDVTAPTVLVVRRTLENLKNESRKAVVFSQAQGRKEDYLLDVERVTHDSKADV